jgi:hypothetical protein
MKLGTFRLLAFLATLPVWSLNAQIRQYLESPEIVWSDWEWVDYKTEKLKLLRHFSDQFPDYMPSPTMEGIGLFLTTDIDADEDPDIIFKGKGTIPAIIFRNDEGNLVKILENPGELISIRREKIWHPITFQLLDMNEKHIELINYAYAFQDSKLSFFPVSIFLLTDRMKLIPENTPPIAFRAPSELVIRTHPDPQHGRIIRSFPKETKGFIIASQLNLSNKIWRLVILKESSYHYRVGWIRSDDLKL